MVKPLDGDVLARISTGYDAYGSGFDNSNQNIYSFNFFVGFVEDYSVQHYYTATFTESGPPSGTTWYVNISNGQSFSSNTSTITFTEINGSYTYTIGNVSGYKVSNQTGKITINGKNISISTTFTSSTSTISSIELYAIIAAVIALGVIVFIIVFRRRI